MSTTVVSTDLEIGKPYIWQTGLYGKIAVHLAKFSPNGKVAVLSIDGGSDATPARSFPELSDGVAFAVIARGEIIKRVRRTRTAKATTHTAEDVI